jgi:hypothetical protein
MKKLSYLIAITVLAAVSVTTSIGWANSLHRAKEAEAWAKVVQDEAEILLSKAAR